jgi:hypothetical protein
VTASFRTADPLSLTGTVVGIVSLGVQVSSGIIQYYNQYKDFYSDTKSTYPTVEQLRTTFSQLETKLKSDILLDRDAANQVSSGIQMCEGRIVELQARLAKIKTKEPAASEKRANLRVAKLQKQGKKILYPLRQGPLGKLRDSISELRDNLASALHALNL